MKGAAVLFQRAHNSENCSNEPDGSPYSANYSRLPSPRLLQEAHRKIPARGWGREGRTGKGGAVYF